MLGDFRTRAFYGRPLEEGALGELARECGVHPSHLFADQSHLTRVFGRLEGVTPARYRHAFVH